MIEKTFNSSLVHLQLAPHMNEIKSTWLETSWKLETTFHSCMCSECVAATESSYFNCKKAQYRVYMFR